MNETLLFYPSGFFFEEKNSKSNLQKGHKEQFDKEHFLEKKNSHRLVPFSP